MGDKSKLLEGHYITAIFFPFHNLLEIIVVWNGAQSC